MSERKVHIGDPLVLRPGAGLVQFLYQSRTLLDQGTAGVVYTNAAGQTHKLFLAGHPTSYGVSRDQINLGVSDDEVALTWQLTAGAETLLRLMVKNRGRHAVHIQMLYVLDVDQQRGGSLRLRSSLANWRFYQNGWQSWSPTFARRLSDGLWINPNTEDYRTKHQPHADDHGQNDLSSEWFTVIVPGAGGDPSLLLGFVSTADQLAEVRLSVHKRRQFESLCAVSYADGVLLEPGEELCSEELLLAAGDDPLALLDLYADRLAARMKARVPDKIPTGWCTWYYFFGEDTVDDVRENLQRIARERLPLDVFVIDDGYETSIGDWLNVDKAKYPDGMAQIAQQIRESGYRPGIWIAPFAASASSTLYANHPDWVLRNEQAEPIVAWQHWGQDIYALDLSLVDVQGWLTDVFRTLSEEWGFEFFKIDFVFSAALAGVRSDARLTRAQALRRGLETIRAVIGDKFLLGCGAPLGPSVGVVDAMRIGPDVHVDWNPLWQDLSAPSVANTLLNTIARGFMHRKLWLNDPDCLPLRPRGDDSNLVLNEMRTLTTAAALSGGLVINSDNTPTIRRGRLKYLRRVLPPYGQRAIPIDLFENERPELFALPVETAWGSWMVVGLLNWSDRSRVTTLDLARLGMPAGRYHAFNYWRQRYLGVVRDEVVIAPHQPHETVLLLLKPVADQLQLLTSTFHVLQGAVEIKDVRLQGTSLIVQMEKPGKQAGYLWFALPSASENRVASATVSGHPQRPRQMAEGVWRVGLTLVDRATVEFTVR